MTINEIKRLCNDNGIKPSKGKGQNFLIDDHALDQIIEAADLTINDYILEIGPGFGVLTEQLLKRSKKVLCVELDKRLTFFLKKKFRGYKNLEILEADILKIKNQQLAEKLGSEKYSIVANLPYAISKPVLQKFLNYEPRPKEMIVLLQKEVAEKITAKPGKMSLLSLSVQFYSRPQIIDYVPGQSFYPQPKVDSAIVRIVISKQQFSAEIRQILSKKEMESFDEKKFWQLVKIGFSSPRKQLQNNLGSGLKMDKQDIKNILKIKGLREDIRPEDLSLNYWFILYQQLMV